MFKNINCCTAQTISESPRFPQGSVLARCFWGLLINDFRLITAKHFLTFLMVSWGDAFVFLNLYMKFWSVEEELLSNTALEMI